MHHRPLQNSTNVTGCGTPWYLLRDQTGHASANISLRTTTLWRNLSTATVIALTAVTEFDKCGQLWHTVVPASGPDRACFCKHVVHITTAWRKGLSTATVIAPSAVAEFNECDEHWHAVVHASGPDRARACKHVLPYNDCMKEFEHGCGYCSSSRYKTWQMWWALAHRGTCIGTRQGMLLQTCSSIKRVHEWFWVRLRLLHQRPLHNLTNVTSFGTPWYLHRDQTGHAFANMLLHTTTAWRTSSTATVFEQATVTEFDKCDEPWHTVVLASVCKYVYPYKDFINDFEHGYGYCTSGRYRIRQIWRALAHRTYLPLRMRALSRNVFFISYPWLPRPPSSFAWEAHSWHGCWHTLCRC